MEKVRQRQHTPLVLIILDGFGLADPEHQGNAITPATAPHIFSYIKKYPSTVLAAHGKDVGLFAGQQGNSEAGHLNIGAGRVVEQDLVMISRAIHDGTFFKNEAFREGMYHAKKHHSAVHLMGLLTNRHSAHARDEHVFALLEYMRRQKQKKVFLHLFTDGRDSSPHGAMHFLSALKKSMKNGEKIASISGRMYAMDRGRFWDRTEQAYHAIVGKGGHRALTAEVAIEQAYNRGETDEYIVPTMIVGSDQKPVGAVKNNDVVYFFNARSDRARQLTKAFVQKDFQKKNSGVFSRKCCPKNIRFIAMTDFGPDLEGVLTAFPSPDIRFPLAKVIGNSFRQLYISEMEKYAHVTYFINGGYADPVNGENREIVRSKNMYSYAKNPQMMTAQVTKKIIDAIRKHTYDMIVVNLPNADMVGHTGNIDAAKKAVVCVDTHVQRIVDVVMKRRGTVIITADHGNAEEMLNKQTGEIVTEHTTNQVPFIIISDTIKKKKLKTGQLADVAPTILKLLHIEPPKEMTGKSLL